MITIRQAIIDDAESVSALLMANTAERGGALYGDWSVGVVTTWIGSGDLILVAIDGRKLVGALFIQEKAQASAAPVVAMLRAWPGRADAYVYGPVCIDHSARGKGVFKALYADLVTRMPAREAILFINATNSRSYHAHIGLGMTEVASFKLGDDTFLVLSTAP